MGCRRLKREGLYAYTKLIHFVVQQKHSIVKQLHSNKNNKLEKEMAPHSSTLAWKIPWTEERTRLQSMGSQGAGHVYDEKK